MYKNNKPINKREKSRKKRKKKKKGKEKGTIKKAIITCIPICVMYLNMKYYQYLLDDTAIRKFLKLYKLNYATTACCAPVGVVCIEAAFSTDFRIVFFF